MRLWTIGHSTRSANEFLALLREHGIRQLIDVRRFPGSRLHPQFNREALAALLEENGIRYRHAPELGGRRHARDDSVNTAWQHAGFRGYADHMASAEFAGGLERLLEDAAAQPSAMMCAEAVPWQCHRNLLADALVARGHDVVHILGPVQSQAHTLNPAARPSPDGTLIYPGSDQEELLL
jgi:uncharacterized protein (DUF488 family)